MLQFPRLTAGQAGEQKSNLLQKKKADDKWCKLHKTALKFHLMAEEKAEQTLH